MARVPRWMEPMRATLTKTYFSDPAWVFEPKLDGIRGLAFVDQGKVRLLSRNKLDLTGSYPAVAIALGEQGGAFVVDGELAAMSDGKTSFSLLQQSLRSAVAVGYFVFDLLWLDGRDMRKRPLLERKSVLAGALGWNEPLYYVEHIVESGEEFHRAACEHGLEGVIAKRADGPYVGSRSRDWLKFKCSNEQELVIGGFTDPQGARSGFGALLVGYYDDGRLRYAGKVGTGYATSFLTDLRARLDALRTEDTPFVDAPARRAGTHWVKPRLVAQVAFAEWTRDGRLRHPRFVGLRTDKRPREVVRETA